jgi:Spy/CpxP family protein refolding chaperone
VIDLKRCIKLARRGVPVLGLSLACGCTVWAQTDGPGGPPPDGGPPPGEMQQQQRGPSIERQLKQLTKLLTLTTDQQTQVKAILTDEHQKIEDLFKAEAASSAEKTSDDDASQPSRQEAMEARRAAMKEIHDDMHVRIVAVLTADQKTKYEAWEKKRAKASRQQDDEMPPPPPDGEGGPPPDGGGPPGI